MSIEQNHGDLEAIQSISIEALDLRYSELRLASPREFARQRRSIERDGIRHPVIVSNAVVNEKLVLIDGFKRVAVARELGQTRLLARVVALNGVAAEVAIITSNSTQRGLADIEEGLIVQSLHRTHGRTQVEIAELLDRSKSWVCRRLRLVEDLAPDVQQDLRLGLTTVSVARELIQLPRGNQVGTARVIADYQLTSRQVTRLVGALRSVDSSQREAILDSPMEHVQALPSQEEPDPRLGAPGNRLRWYILRIEGASNRIVEVLRRHRPGKFTSTEVQILRTLAEPILPEARKALALVETLIDAVGS